MNQSTKARVFAIVIGLAVPMVVGFCLGGRIPPGEILRVESSSLHFGEVWVQSDFAWNVPIHNVSSQQVEIDDFLTSCGCITVTPKSVVLDPGESAEMTLKLDLRAERSEHSTKRRHFTAGITPVMRHQLGSGVSWQVSGYVKSAIQLPARVGLERDIIKNVPITIETRTFPLLSQLDSVSVSCDEELGDCAVSLIGEPPSEFQMRFEPKATLPVGSYEAEAWLSPIALGGAHLPKFSVAVNFHIVNDVACTPASLVFGVVPIGTVAESVVSLRARTGGDFAVKEIALASNATLVELIENTKNPRVRVSQRAELPKSQQAEIRFLIERSTDGLMEELRIPVHYYGLGEN